MKSGSIINGVFMFGFAYVVEACAIYISKNQEPVHPILKIDNNNY